MTSASETPDAADSFRMRAHFPALCDRLAQTLRPGLGTQGRVAGMLVLVLVAVLVLAGQQALQIVRRDAGATLRIQASAQLAALSQGVVDPAVLRDRTALRAHLKAPLARGNLRYVEYTAPNGHILREEAPPYRADRPDWFAELTGLAVPLVQEAIVIGGTYHGRLTVQPSSHAYEDFLWHLGTRLSVLLAAAFALLGWLTPVLPRIKLRDLTRLRATARRIEAGDYSTHIPIRAGSPPGLQQTTRAFNHMGAALEQLLTDLNEQQKALDSTANVSETDLAGNITFVNDLFCSISGYTREELIGRNHRIVDSGWHDAAFFRDLWETISNGRTWRGEICNRAKDGRLFWTASTVIPIKDDAGLPLKYLSIRFDITQRKLDEAALSEEKARWQVTLQSINDAVIVTNARNQVTYLNPAAENLLGIALDEAALSPLKSLMQIDQMGGGDEAPVCFLSPASAPHNQTGSAQLHTRLGQNLAISYSCAPLSGHGGLGAVYVLRDETEKKQLLDSLREMAFHDPLTALPNRRAVEGRLARAMRTARDRSQQHAFCYIDLDQFKLVNDTCGHSVGDTLLTDIAQTMKAALPAHAYLGRLGGDEFGLILFDTRPELALQVCRQLVQRIRDFRFEHKGRRFTLGACAGIAPITQAATTAGGIMVQADMACYRAKSEGSGRVVLYEADEVGFRRLEAEMGWAADFAQALEANQFLPYRQLIQPASHDGQPHYEVLIRWQRNGLIEFGLI
ncbi:MAG: diguanylate cyclase, partial [Candidatus Thermoplasmatota archaeon]|nr:diguanylate cyclase [Candidatus Thermoplasmatota archaeon]